MIQDLRDGRSPRHTDRAPNSGASMVEFSIALAILAVVFLFGSLVLRDSAEDRFRSSTQVVNDIVPCGETIGGQDCL